MFLFVLQGSADSVIGPWHERARTRQAVEPAGGWDSPPPPQDRHPSMQGAQWPEETSSLSSWACQCNTRKQMKPLMPFIVFWGLMWSVMCLTIGPRHVKEEPGSWPHQEGCASQRWSRGAWNLHYSKEVSSLKVYKACRNTWMNRLEKHQGIVITVQH